MYYLDTVTIRKLSKELPQLKHNCFTSALSIFELISGISEKEFYIRKQVLKNLFDSQVPIIWELPEAMKAYAFPIIEIKESRVLGLKKICFELLRSESLETLILNTRNEIYNVSFFNQLDGIYSRGFIESTIKGNDTLKKIYNAEREKNGELFENFSKNFVKSLQSNEEMNNFITLQAIASYLSDFASKSNDIVTQEELVKSYNNGINTFIKAFSLFTAQKSAELGNPAKNDFVDLHHLLYLGNNPNYYIITDDKMVIKITKQAKTILEFKKINGI